MSKATFCFFESVNSICGDQVGINADFSEMMNGINNRMLPGKTHRHKITRPSVMDV